MTALPQRRPRHDEQDSELIDRRVEADRQHRLDLIDQVANDILRIRPQGLDTCSRSVEYRLMQASVEAFCSNESDEGTIDWPDAQEVLKGRISPEDLRYRVPPEEEYDQIMDAKDLLATGEMAIEILEGKAAAVEQHPSPEEWVNTLRGRNRRLLEHRPDRFPGMIKQRDNKASDGRGEEYLFSPKEHCTDVLYRTYDVARLLPPGISRAILIGYGIVEAHYFTDANGRTSRTGMNAELVASNEEPIIQTFGFRRKRIEALAQVRDRKRPSADALIAIALEQQEWTAQQPWDDEELLIELLVQGGHIKRAERKTTTKKDRKRGPSIVDDDDDDGII